jgi:transcriptional regulator with XRE-family HTH domain
LRQEDLEKWGFSYRYYGKLERGLVNPTLDTLVRLCEVYEISLTDLFLFTDSSTAANEDNEAVAAKVGEILRANEKAKIRKLRIFLNEVL